MSFEKLKPVQQRFVNEYVSNGGIAYRAYMVAYPKAKSTTAMTESSKYLRNPKIKMAINEQFAKIWPEKDLEGEKGKTYQMIHILGNSNITDVIDLENGTLRVRDFKDIPSEALQAIQSIEYNEIETKSGIHRSIKVKMHPKLQALELKARIQKMIDNKIELPVDIIIKPAIRPHKKQLEE